MNGPKISKHCEKASCCDEASYNYMSCPANWKPIKALLEAFDLDTPRQCSICSVELNSDNECVGENKVVPHNHHICYSCNLVYRSMFTFAKDLKMDIFGVIRGDTFTDDHDGGDI